MAGYASAKLDAGKLAGCCLNANRNATGVDLCSKFFSVTHISHAGTFLAMETAIFSLLPKL